MYKRLTNTRNNKKYVQTFFHIKQINYIQYQ